MRGREGEGELQERGRRWRGRQEGEVMYDSTTGREEPAGWCVSWPGEKRCEGLWSGVVALGEAQDTCICIGPEERRL